MYRYFCATLTGLVAPSVPGERRELTPCSLTPAPGSGYGAYMTDKPEAENLIGPITLKIVSVGNSKGVRIPSAILRRQGMANEVECIETIDGVWLRAKKTNELSFEEAFDQLAIDQEALAEIQEMEGTIGDGLEKDEYSE
jgi:antitoxin MazE